MQDVIERTIQINAPMEQIYAAITDPELLTQWFPNSVEGDLSPGQQPLFGFGEHGKSRIYVVAAEPHHHFAYRWVPGANHYDGDVLKVATTLVEFNITEEAVNRCTVTVTESGFMGLGQDIQADAFKQNNQGWNFMLNRLTQMLVEAV